MVFGPFALAVNSCVFLLDSSQIAIAAIACRAFTWSRTAFDAFLFDVCVAAWLWCVFTTGPDTNMHSYFAGKHVHMSGTILQVQCFVLQCVLPP